LLLARIHVHIRVRRELKYYSLGGIDGASDGGEQGPARAVELGGATVRGASAERGRHEVRSDR